MSVSSPANFSTTGIQLPTDACVVIVRTAWNAASVDKLEEGCARILNEHHIIHSTIMVPGAFEIPFTIRSYWETVKYKENKPLVFIALGCVLRGDTPHFEYVCRAVTDGVMQLNLFLPVPIIFGVLTVDDQLQIDERTGGKHGHKGEEAAYAALKMIEIIGSFK